MDIGHLFIWAGVHQSAQRQSGGGRAVNESSVDEK